MRLNVYVDGFNLYYGSLRRTPELKWLDLSLLAKQLFPRHQLGRVRYFTARVSGRFDSRAPQRQDAYLRALSSIPEVSIHEGFFMSGVKRMRLADPPADQNPFVSVIYSEEKGSDVNLATYLLLDAFEDDMDEAAVISNDSDLAEPIRIAEEVLGKSVHLINPTRRAKAAALRAKSYRTLRKGALRACQLPDVAGGVRRPGAWT